MRIENTEIGQAMRSQLKKEGYISLTYNTFFQAVKDTPGYQYIRLAKIQQDTNSGSIQLNKMSISEDDLTIIVGKVLGREMIK